MFEKLRWFGLFLFVIHFAKFGGLSNFPIYGISILLSATLIHELSHYCLARIWSSDCTIKWKLSLKPATTIYHSPQEMPNQCFKLVGAAPLGVGMIGLFLFVIFTFNGLPFDSTAVIVMIGLSSGLIASMSESDEFAIRYPAAFREYATDHDQWNSDVAQEYL